MKHKKAEAKLTQFWESQRFKEQTIARRKQEIIDFFKIDPRMANSSIAELTEIARKKTIRIQQQLTKTRELLLELESHGVNISGWANPKRPPKVKQLQKALVNLPARKAMADKVGLELKLWHLLTTELEFETSVKKAQLMHTIKERKGEIKLNTIIKQFSSADKPLKQLIRHEIISSHKIISANGQPSIAFDLETLRRELRTKGIPFLRDAVKHKSKNFRMMREQLIERLLEI